MTTTKTVPELPEGSGVTVYSKKEIAGFAFRLGENNFMVSLDELNLNRILYHDQIKITLHRIRNGSFEGRSI
jgi:hypothetical protein